MTPASIPGLPGNPQATPNPWLYTARDSTGKAISISFPWDSTTRALQNATIQADQGCMYTTIYIGFGADGQVLSSAKKIPVPQGVGARTFAAGQMSSMGLNTIDDILTSQITAAP